MSLSNGMASLASTRPDPDATSNLNWLEKRQETATQIPGQKGLAKRKRQSSIDDLDSDAATEAVHRCDHLDNSTHLPASSTSEKPPRSKRKQVRLKIDIPPNPSLIDNHNHDDSLFTDDSLNDMFLASPDSVFDDINDIEQLNNRNNHGLETLSSNTTSNPTTSNRPPKSPPCNPPPPLSQPLAMQPFPAVRTAPPVPGLYFTPSLLLPQDLADSVLTYCMKTYFSCSEANQVMLFGRAPQPDSTFPSQMAMESTTGFPTPLLDLLSHLSIILKPHLPRHIHTLLFPESPQSQPQARQAIINLYQPGEGITSHLDLLSRFGDGIIGVSLGSGCVMRFDNVEDPLASQSYTESQVRIQARDSSKEGGKMKSRWDLYLPQNTVVVLSGDARYRWTHGIERRAGDLVEDLDIEPHGNDEEATDGNISTDRGTTSPPSRSNWIKRDMRLSITFRWLLPGADIVGPATDALDK